MRTINKHVLSINSAVHGEFRRLCRNRRLEHVRFLEGFRDGRHLRETKSSRPRR